MFRVWLMCAGLLGATGVAMAAWLAHGLPQWVAPDQLAQSLERARSANLQQMLHALALLGVGVWSRQSASVWVHCAGALFALGVLGFSGGIYALYIFQLLPSGTLNNIVPAGGLCLMAAWLCVAIAGLRERRPSTHF